MYSLVCSKAQPVQNYSTQDINNPKWGCSSAGRAPALQAGGQEFDPPHLHHSNLKKVATDLFRKTIAP